MKTLVKNYLYASGAAKVRNYFCSLSQKDILFVWIPKSAGTSIFNFLQQSGGRNFYSVYAIKRAFPQRGIATFGHMKLSDLVRENIVSKKYLSSAYKFSFVRNPYDRTVSTFTYYKEIGRIDRNLEFKRFCEQIFSKSYPVCGLFNDKGLSHCNPQSSYIFTEDDKAVVNFTGKFETLATDLEYLSRKLGLPYVTLPRLNKSSHNHFSEYYDDESVEMIKCAYKRDFLLLDYDFVLPQTLPPASAMY